MFNHSNNHSSLSETSLKPNSPLETESLSDTSFLTHPLIISSLCSTSQHLQPLIAQASSLTQQSLPIKSQFSSKHKSDYSYQHPAIHSFPLTTLLQSPVSLFEPSSSFLNTYNLNSSFKNLALSLYSNSIYSTYLTSLSDVTSRLPELKHSLTASIRSITTSPSSNSFNSQLMIINIGLNQFTSLSFANVGDVVQYSRTFRNNFSMLFNNEKDNIMYVYILLNKDIQKIFAKINDMLHSTTDTHIRKQLVNVVFNLSACLKLLYGYLRVAEYLQEWNVSIDEEDLKWHFKDCSMTAGECGYCGFMNVTEGRFGTCGFNVGLNDNKDAEISKFAFSDLRGCFGRKDLMFLYMEGLGLMKVAKTCVKDSEYNVIQYKKIDNEFLYGSNNSNNNAYTNAFNYLLFAYEECYLFLFNINSFQTQEESDDKLFTIIDFNLNNISNNINITCDHNVREILYTKSMNIYLNKLTNVLSDVSGIPTSSIGSNKLSIAFENNKLYIIHPICSIPKHTVRSAKSGNEYIDFLSNEYIYVCDIIQLASNETYMNDIVLTYVDTCVLCRCVTGEDTQHGGTRQLMDKLFQEKTTSNLFVVGNGVLYSKYGDYIYNTRMSLCRKHNCDNKKAFIIPESQVNNNIVLCYEHYIYSLSDRTFDNNKRISIFEKTCMFNSYAKSNSFNSNVLLREINTQLIAYNEQGSIPSASDNNDIFNDLFNTPTTTVPIDDNNNGTMSNVSSLNQIDLILFNLCIYLDRTKCHSVSKAMKDKHVLSLDYPTLMCFNRLISVNKTNAKRLFCLLMLLKNHFANMKSNKVCASVVFGKESVVYESIDLLMKVSKDVQDMKELIYEIVFDLLCICEFIKGKQLDDILCNMDFIRNNDINSKCYLCLFDYCCYSKANMNHFTSSDYCAEINARFISHLAELEINSLDPKASSTHNKLNKSFHLFHKHYLTFYSHFYSNVIHNAPLHNNTANKHLSLIYNNLSSLILPHFSNQPLLRCLLTSSSFIIPLLHFTVSITLSTYSSLPNAFTLQFWQFFFALIQSLSSLKQRVLSTAQRQIPLQHQHDIIIDNTAFTNEQSKSIVYAPAFHESEVNLYIETIVINKQNDSSNNNNSSNSCANIVSIENNKTNVKLLNINACCGGNNTILYEYHKIPNVNVENEMKITFHADAKSFLVKVRISNYEWSLRYIDIILEPCIELFNRMLHTFANYSIEEETNGYYQSIMSLFNTRLFSQGFPLEKASTYLNDDIELFCKGVSHCETFKNEFTANANSYEVSNSAVFNDNSNSVPLDTLLSNDKLNKVLSSFDDKQRILIKGDIPDLLVKIAFYIILKHENILTQFTSFHNADNHSTTHTMIVSSSMKQNVDDNYSSIWKGCSTLRAVYKSKKDAYMNSNTNTNVSTAFSDVISKLQFIYDLPPQPKQSHMCYNSKLSFTNAFSNIIKEHVDTITSIVTNDTITQQTIVKGYEYVQIKAKFREISIQILTKAISAINDNSVISNMLCNYYNSFVCKVGNGNSAVSLPSIYDSLLCVNEKIVMNITEAFHKLLGVVVNKIKHDANMNRFDMSVFVNFLMWNMRKRNYRFIIASKVFELFHTNNNNNDDGEHLSFIDKGNKYLFVYPQTESTDNKFIHFSEITPIDDCHIGKLLSDVFECYATRIIHLDMVNINAHSNSSSDSETLLEMILDVLVNQLCVIISLCDKQQNSNNSSSNSDSDNISNYTFPYEHNINHSDFFVKSTQLKLYNVLNIVNKICVLYSRKNNYVFKHYELWAKIFTLLTYANYTNTRLIFSVLKQFTQIEEDNIVQFYDDHLLLNSKRDGTTAIKDYFNYILTACKYKDLVCDYFVNYSLTVGYNDVCEFITNKIINEEQLYLLLFFNVNMNLITHFSPLITNAKLLLENKAVDYEVTQRELDLFIAKGYFISKPTARNYTSTTNSSSGNTGNINHNSNDHSRRVSRRSSGNSSSSSSSRSRRRSGNSNSSGSNASSHCDIGSEYKDLEEVLNTEIPVKRELPVLLADMKDSSNVDFINVNQNEITYDDSYLHKSIPSSLAHDSNATYINTICEYIMNYIKENLFVKGRISPFYIEHYIRALKFLIRCSNSSTTCVNIKAFSTANKHYIDNILQHRLPCFDCSLLFTDKIENITAFAIDALADKNENVSERYFESEEGNEKEMKVKHKCYCMIDSCGNTISLFGDDHKWKYTMSIVDRVELSCNKKEELFEGEVVVLNKKEYEAIVAKSEEKKKELLRNVVFVLCEDLLEELGVSETDYVESQERKVMKYGENENDDTASEEEEENDESPEYYSKDESVPSVKQRKKGKRNKNRKKSKEEENNENNINDNDRGDDAEITLLKTGRNQSLSNENAQSSSIHSSQNGNDNDNDNDNKSQHNKSCNDCNNSNKTPSLKTIFDSPNNNPLTSKAPQSLPKLFQSASWKTFLTSLLSHCDLTKCHFIMESKYFHRIPKNFSVFSYNSASFPTTSLSQDTIYSSITSKLAFPFEAFDIQSALPKPAQPQSPPNDGVYQQVLSAFKVKTKREKQKIRNRFLNPKLTFNKLNTCTPLLTDDTALLTHEQVIHHGIYLIKYYLLLLLITNKEEIPFNHIKLLYYISLYQAKYFNIKHVFTLVQQSTHTYIDKLLCTGDIADVVSKCEVFDYQKAIYQDTMIDALVQDEFIKDVYDYITSATSGENEISQCEMQLCTSLLTKANMCLYNNDLEQSVIIMNIINHISHHSHHQLRVLTLIMESQFVCNISKQISLAKAPRQTDFNITCIEFLINQWVIIDSKQFPNFHIDGSVLRLYKDYTILLNKFSCKHLISNIALNTPEYKANTKCIVHLPLKQGNNSNALPYAVKIHKAYTDKYFIPSQQPFANDNGNILSLFELSSSSANISNNVHYNMSTNITTRTNSIAIINDNIAQFSSYVITHFDNLKPADINRELPTIRAYPFIKTVHCINDSLYIGIGYDNKIYTYGTISGNHHNRSKTFVYSPELNSINNEDTIQAYGKKAFVSESGIYFCKADFPEEIDTVRVSDNIRKFNINGVLPSGDRFVMVKYFPMLIALTQSGKMYGNRCIGDKFILFENESEANPRNALKLLQTKPTHIVVDFAMDYDVLIYAAYDTELHKNIVLANGRSKYWYIFNEECEELFYGKEILYLADKNITQVLFQRDEELFFVAKDGKAFSLKSSSSNFNEIKHFNRKQYEHLSASNVGQMVCFTAVSECTGKKEFLLSGSCDNLDTFVKKAKNGAHPHLNLIDYDVYMSKHRKKDVKDNNNNKLCICKAMNCLLTFDYKLFPCFDVYVPGVNVLSVFGEHKDKGDGEYKFICEVVDNSNNGLRYVIELIKVEKEANNAECFVFGISPSSSDNSSVTVANDDYVFVDKSTKQCELNVWLIEQLSLFVVSVEHVCQIALCLHEKKVNALLNKPLHSDNNVYTFSKSKILSLGKHRSLELFIFPNTNAPSEYDSTYRSIYAQIQDTLSSLTVDDLTEYLSSKQFFLSNKPTLPFPTLTDFLLNKYRTYDKYSHLSNAHILNILDNASHEFISSARNLLKHSSLTLSNSIINTLVFDNIPLIDKPTREEFFKKHFKALHKNTNTDKISISRVAAMKHKASATGVHQGAANTDSNFTWTVFAQLMDKLSFTSSDYYLKPKGHELFNVILEGEGAFDAGGPFREIVTLAFEELTSTYLDLFIPTPNNKSQSGNDRDKYTINPKANTAKHLNAFEFLGKFIAYVISSECYVSLPLSSFVYKQILNLPVEASDIASIDVHAYNSIIKVLSSGGTSQKASLYNVIDFTCQLSDGEVVELKENGRNVMLNADNEREYLELYLQARVSECAEQTRFIRKGLYAVIPHQLFKFLTWEDLEEKICGEPFFNVELFRKNTRYEGFKESDPTIKYFWRFINECTLEEKYQYIKFVWGRSRLPKDSEWNEDKHEISKMEDVKKEDVDMTLPVSHTCFFMVNLPPYTSYQVLKEKLLYSMRNSFIISDSDLQLDLDIK